MRRFHIIAAILLSASVVLVAGAALAVEMGQVKSQICKARATCRLTMLKTAGKSEAGVALFVAEIALGLADKPADGPDGGCLSSEGDNDGGREYWLVEEGKAPQLLLKLCNDGYGAAGIGDDQVTVASNRLTHVQSGGSNDRWEVTETVALSPRRSLDIDFCGYRASGPSFAALSRIDVGAMTASSAAIDDAVKKDDDVGDDPCSLLKDQVRLPAAAGFLSGVDLLLPHLEGDPEGPPAGFVKGTVLGSCASRIPLDAAHSYLVYGKPDEGRTAELTVLALDRKTVLLQLYDPRPDKTPAKSWVAADHIELWSTEDPGMVNHADPSKVQQIGIGLDGKAYAGVGKPDLPAVEQWPGTDSLGRSVTVLRIAWADEGSLAGGLSIAYSESEGGRQARIFATGPIAKNRPIYLPGIDDVPVACSAGDGLWNVTRNPGQLQGVEVAN